MSEQSIIELEGGKYIVIRHSDGRMEALRYGEPWRDLTGDKLIGAMFDEIMQHREAQSQQKGLT